MAAPRPPSLATVALAAAVARMLARNLGPACFEPTRWRQVHNCGGCIVAPRGVSRCCRRLQAGASDGGSFRGSSPVFVASRAVRRASAQGRIVCCEGRCVANGVSAQDPRVRRGRTRFGAAGPGRQLESWARAGRRRAGGSGGAHKLYFRCSSTSKMAAWLPQR